MENIIASVVFFIIFVNVINSLLGKQSLLYCGICGFTGKGSIDTIKMKVLLIYNQTRGDQATGMWSDNGGTYKKAISAKEFIKTFSNLGDAHTVIGHTRFGTHGSNTDSNSHPHASDNIIAVHNGVLSNHDTLGKQYGFSVVVDSEAIPHMIKQKGPKGLEEITGNMAIAYVDTNHSDVLYLVRKDNPIYVGEAEEGLYFSSIEQSLKEIKCINIKPLPIGKLHEYRHGELVSTTDITFKTYYGRNWDDYGDYGYSRPMSRTKKAEEFYEKYGYDKWTPEFYDEWVWDQTKKDYVLRDTKKSKKKSITLTIPQSCSSNTELLEDLDDLEDPQEDYFWFTKSDTESIEAIENFINDIYRMKLKDIDSESLLAARFILSRLREKIEKIA